MREAWFLTLRKKTQIVGVGNRVLREITGPKRDKVTED
jgi:hypothetical protein